MKTRPNAKMKFQSWMTTDEEERAKRRERASIESMRVKEIAPVTADQLAMASGELDLPSECDFVLETAVKGGRLDMPDAVNAARALVEQCRMMWK